mmetsp:Transcript_29139/g.37592  ORF Transcript_29139/g.37592 Transcript_29139/m.37592 type:complete len:164 (+) Transcript_29139:69-560(+)
MITSYICGTHRMLHCISKIRLLRRFTEDSQAISIKVSPISKLVSLFKDQDNLPLILDVRDPNEVLSGKGGPPNAIPGSLNVPLNHEGIGQRERKTTLNEFLSKIKEKGVKLPSNKNNVIITHCGKGGRGGKAASLLQMAGYNNVYNGGGPSIIATAMKSVSDE